MGEEGRPVTRAGTAINAREGEGAAEALGAGLSAHSLHPAGALGRSRTPLLPRPSPLQRKL